MEGRIHTGHGGCKSCHLITVECGLFLVSAPLHFAPALELPSLREPISTIARGLDLNVLTVGKEDVITDPAE